MTVLLWLVSCHGLEHGHPMFVCWWFIVCVLGSEAKEELPIYGSGKSSAKGAKKKQKVSFVVRSWIVCCALLTALALWFSFLTSIEQDEEVADNPNVELAKQIMELERLVFSFLFVSFAHLLSPFAGRRTLQTRSERISSSFASAQSSSASTWKS
jgi:hypothetical protein